VERVAAWLFEFIDGQNFVLFAIPESLPLCIGDGVNRA
jgi:hypothetical protein